MINSIRASIPTGTTHERRRLVKRLGQARQRSSPATWRSVRQRAQTALVHGAVVGAYGPSKSRISVPPGVGDDLGVVRAGDQYGDADAKRGDLACHRFAPTFERTLDSGIRCGHGHSTNSCRAGEQARCGPGPRLRIARQKRLGERHRAEDVGCEHLAPTRSSASLRPFRPRAIPALCTRASGAPTASSIDFAAASDRRGVGEVEPRHRSAADRRQRHPVASRSFSIPASTDRIAPTTRQPHLYKQRSGSQPEPP